MNVSVLSKTTNCLYETPKSPHTQRRMKSEEETEIQMGAAVTEKDDDDFW